MEYYDINENNNFLENEFFIIDSYNLNNINSNLYGYILNNEGIITNENMREDLKLDSQGAYVFVKKDGNEIKIYQDFIGSYGLYIFKKEDYFAVSNSFLKLIEFLNENNHGLTLNRDYAETYLSIDLCSLSYSETLVNEIKLIPRNHILKIDVKSKSLGYEIIDYEENTIFLDTEEGIRLLDEWFYKWVNLFRILEANNQDIVIDLNGEITEFKLIMSIIIAAGIDLNRVIINPSNAKSHPENFELAMKISREIGFELDCNDSLFDKINNIDLPLQVYSYTKLGFHKETYELDLPKKPVFLISGLGSEGLCDYLDQSVEKMIKIRSHSSKTYFSNYSKSLESNIHRSIEEIQNTFDIVNNSNNELIKIFYRETRSRFLFGKQNIENYLFNRITLTPFLDEDLYKLKNIRGGYADKDFILCMIFTRYCQDSLDSGFDQKPNFNEDTVDYVKELNSRFPFKNSFKFNDIDHAIPTKNILTYKNNLKNQKNELQKVNIDNFIKNVFFTEHFRKSFIRYFHPFAYYNISGSIIRKPKPLDAYSAISVVRVMDIMDSNITLDNFSWFKHFLNFNVEEESDNSINNKFSKYNTAVIYMKNYGNSENNISILESSADSSCDILKPLWLKDDEGNGIAIYSKKGQLDLKIKFMNKGLFKLSFKGLMFRDAHDRKVPIFIDYKNFFVNENQIFKNKINTCYDAPYEYIRDVENNEIMNIHIEWEPFDSNIYQFD